MASGSCADCRTKARRTSGVIDHLGSLESGCASLKAAVLPRFFTHEVSHSLRMSGKMGVCGGSSEPSVFCGVASYKNVINDFLKSASFQKRTCTRFRALVTASGVTLNTFSSVVLVAASLPFALSTFW